MKSLGLLPWMLVEKLLNSLLRKDPKALDKLQRLSGTVFKFDLKELPFVLTVIVEDDALRLSTVSDVEADCWVATEMGVLPELKDTANLTRLIKAGQLDIEGDPTLAQQLVSVVKELDVDWESELERYVGASFAHWLSQLWQRSRAHWVRQKEQSGRWLTGVVIEEKQLLPARIEYEQFKRQVQQLRADIERLERQLKGDVNA